MLNSLFRICQIALVVSLLLTSPGCSYFKSAESESEDELADFEADGSEKSKDDSDLDSDDSSGELKLKVKVGDQFPLMKRIEQRLTQSDGQGKSVSRSLIEMMLSLKVEDIRDGNRLLSVRYHRIRYGHNIAGKKVEYNSDANDRVPVEALVYAGLKDNSFSFWIGPDNRVIELVGFSDFLQRCVRDVPSQYRDSVMKQLENTHSEEGLANFVDDGIGLLPFSNDPRHPAVAVKVGSTWELKPRRSEGPIPISTNTRCVLKSLSETSAEIGLLGKIGGTLTPVTVQDGNRTMHVLVKGGHCAGNCTVDRRTGLPTQSEVNRYLEMSIKLADGSEISQSKEILTSISTFPDQGPRQETASDSNRDSSRRGSSFASEHGSDRVTQASNSTSDFEGPRESRSIGRNAFERPGRR